MYMWDLTVLLQNKQKKDTCVNMLLPSLRLVLKKPNSFILNIQHNLFVEILHYCWLSSVGKTQYCKYCVSISICFSTMSQHFKGL